MAILLINLIPLPFFLILGIGFIIAVRKTVLAEKQSVGTPREDFSHIEYLSRVKAICESIWQEPAEEYTLILWWGLDGLRLNKDGTREWINKARRNVREISEAEIVETTTLDDRHERYILALESRNMPQSFCVDNPQHTLWELKAQNDNLRLQAAQIEINKAVIDMLGVSNMALITHHLQNQKEATMYNLPCSCNDYLSFNPPSILPPVPPWHKPLFTQDNNATTKREDLKMKVSYKDYTGDLVKLESYKDRVNCKIKWNLTLQCEDGVRISFERLDLCDISFSGGSMRFEG